MSPTGPDGQRTRFRRPIGVAVMAYKAVLGLSEIVVGGPVAFKQVDCGVTTLCPEAEQPDCVCNSAAIRRRMRAHNWTR
jgi:hypothetical protein